MVPTAELLVVETTRSAACPKQLSTKRYRRERKLTSTFRTHFFFYPTFPTEDENTRVNAAGRAPRDVGTVIQRELRRVGRTYDTLEV
jgi:hypothetical protein